MRGAGVLIAWGVVIGSALGALAAPPAANRAGPGVSPEAEAFFEKNVRPVLVENCFACHGPERQMSSLRLDSAAGLAKGAATGAVVVAGEPEKSALVKAIRYDATIKMPPTGKLKPEQIAALTEWVKMGAPWPAGQGAAGAAATVDTAAAVAAARRKHWSFQLVRLPRLPAVKTTAWPASPIDRFILARLEQKGMKPSPPADRRTLIRRATFDLIGLPPTPEEVQAFLADSSPDAFARVVDRLLASPHYGERWGRHWLDVARYADTKGYVFQEERRYPYAYTYRDYVVRAFNEDKPYDRFLVEQIAADRLPLGQDKSALAAMGFLTLGRRFLNNQNDIIDDRIDVLTRGTMGLTVACARCHDHKFDPIPTSDYYALHGVFASSVEPKELPMIALPARTAAYIEFEKELNARKAEADRFLASKTVEALARVRAQTAEYLGAVLEAQKLGDDQRRFAFARSRDLNASVLRRWVMFLEETRKAHHPVFAAWHAFAALPEPEFAARAAAVAQKVAANDDPVRPHNPLVARAFAGPAPASMRDVAQRYGALFSEVDQLWQKTAQPVDGKEAVAGLLDADREALRRVLYADDAPPNVPAAEADRLLNRAERDRLQALRRKVDELQATSPAAPPRAMVMEDMAVPVNPRILIRGNPNNPGAEVPRQFLLVLAGEDRKPFRLGSGRLELARAIASKDNPLTARVMVNRIWLHHFGAGLVRTPSDLGTRGEPPTHPELLDYLAWKFMESGWSVKKLHRLVMLSSTYQQSSEERPRYRPLDPENRLLSRMNRHRLDLEAMRDSLLAVAGRLDRAVGGPAVEITTAPHATRRTLYGFIDRQNLQGLFRTFDFASPDTTSPQRYSTTVPQQALFMMNSPFVIEQARFLASRSEVSRLGAAEQRIRQLYRLLYGREADPSEVQIGLHFLNTAPAPGLKPEKPAPPVWQYGYGYYDDAARRLARFDPLPHWTGYFWQGGPEFPDVKLGHLRLTPTGGHPGRDPRHAAIRRWVAPRDAVLTVSGAIEHMGKEGDGVQAYLVSSRAGELGRWTAQDAKVDTALTSVEVKRGETLDFIVACRSNPDSDTFNWAPAIRTASSTQGTTAETTEWSARTGFGGPPPEAARPLSTWERYVQALLLANEFLFVD